MAQAALRHIVFGLAAFGLLAGCVQGTGTGGVTGSPAASTARAGAAGDVEAPEVFQVTDSALWDGRPSLGGIWVASPEAQNPERVVMFNPATGKSVQGALFKRERDNPGPRLQISSDAAEALGILAGQPSEIRVTALRRAEPEAPAAATVPPAEVATAEVATDGGTAAESGADASAEATAAAATAALAAAGSAAVDGEDAATAADGVTDAAGEAVAATEPPKRKTWKERRAEAKAAREAKKAAAEAAKAAAAAGATVDGAAEVPATPEAAGVAVIETAPLDATGLTTAEPATTAEAAPAAEPAKTRRQRRAEEEAAAAAAAAATAPVVEAPVAAGRTIQVASFSKEENATRAVEALGKIGVTAQARKSETGGKVVWGVVATGDAELLKSIKAAGFADAFFLQ
jgi:hypothetical protein